VGSIPTRSRHSRAMTVKRALVVLNPVAGRGRGSRLGRPIAEAFRDRGWHVEMRPTTRPGEERDLAFEGARDGWELVIAAGGDGTVHGVANGILAAERPETTLGIIGIGTGNDFAKLTGLPVRAVKAAVEALERGRPRRFDVGRVAGEYFTNGLGVGFDTAVLDQMQRYPNLRGFALYVAAVLRAFARFRPVTVGLASAEHTHTGPLVLAEVAIGTTAGGGFRLTPRADPTDGLFDVCAIREVGFLRFVRYLPRVIAGRHEGLAEVTAFRTAHIRITTPGIPLTVHLDGELRRYDAPSVEAEVVTQRLPVLCVS